MKLARLSAATAALAAAVVLVACSSGPTQTRPPGSLYLSAYQTAFVESRVDATANTAFQLWFENRDGFPHNVNVADATGASVARSEVISGPAGVALNVPALAPGTYKLLCDVHPEMRSELVAN